MPFKSVPFFLAKGCFQGLHSRDGSVRIPFVWPIPLPLASGRANIDIQVLVPGRAYRWGYGNEVTDYVTRRPPG